MIPPKAYIIPQNCVISKEEQKFLIPKKLDPLRIEEAPDPATTEKLSPGEKHLKIHIDFSAENTFSLLTRCVQANQYLTKPQIHQCDGLIEDEERFMRFYYSHYEHFYTYGFKRGVNQQSPRLNRILGIRKKYTTDKEIAGDLDRTSEVPDSRILVRNTSNTSLFPFFIFLRAKLRTYWKKSYSSNNSRTVVKAEAEEADVNFGSGK